MTQDINLQWPSFNVDLNTVDAWVKANAASGYIGMSADYDLSLHYSSDPGDTVREAVAAYWAGLNSGSPEATNYESQASREAAAAAAKASALASATSKLEALGLSANEIKALIGS